MARELSENHVAGSEQAKPGIVPQRRVRISKDQRRVLREIDERNVSGMCLKYVWTFILGNVERVTGVVKALEGKGLVHIAYYGGGSASVNLTDAGRAELAASKNEGA